LIAIIFGVHWEYRSIEHPLDSYDRIELPNLQAPENFKQ